MKKILEAKPVFKKIGVGIIKHISGIQLILDFLVLTIM